MAEKLPTLLDNRGENTVFNAFHRLLPHSRRWDVATGYFEVGSLLDLDGSWQELVMALQSQSEMSLETAKEKDDSLRGLAGIRQALDAKRGDVLDTPVGGSAGLI